MLQHVLRVLATGGTHRFSDLAHGLGISEGLLQAMMEELVRMGYLKVVNPQCGSTCSHCAEACACTLSGGARVWVLTEAGRRLAQG